MTRLRAIVTSLSLAALPLVHEATAQVSERTLRWAQQNSLEYPQGQGSKKFADLVEQKSGGKIKVRIFRAASSAAIFRTCPRSRAERSISWCSTPGSSSGS